MESPQRLHVRVFPAGTSWYDPGWGHDAHELVAELEHDDREVIVELPKPHFNYSVAPTWENLAIFIAGGVSTQLLPLVVADLYEGTKRFVRKRFEKKEETGEVRVTIYGPDDKPLKRVVGYSADNVVEEPS